MTTKEHIENLSQITHQIIEDSEELFGTIGEEIFNHTIEPKKWSIAQIFNHLNYYSSYYHKQFYKILDSKEKNELKKEREKLKYSWLYKNIIKYIELDGDLKPKRKSKAPKKSFQVNSDFTKKEFDVFINNQKELLSILEMAQKNGNFLQKKVKTMFPLVSLKAYDMLSLHVHHNFRHLQQAKNTLAEVRKNLN